MTNQTTTKYTTEFRQLVLQKLQTKEIKSIEEARRIYSIGGKMTIQKWAKAMNVNLFIRKNVKADAGFETGNSKLLLALGRSYLRIIELEDLLRIEHGNQVQ